MLRRPSRARRQAGSWVPSHMAGGAPEYGDGSSPAKTPSFTKSLGLLAPFLLSSPLAHPTSQLSIVQGGWVLGLLGWRPVHVSQPVQVSQQPLPSNPVSLPVDDQQLLSACLAHAGAIRRGAQQARSPGTARGGCGVTDTKTAPIPSLLWYLQGPR